MSPLAALIPRTAALIVILYQIRLLATDLADTPVFIAALTAALLTAVFLHKFTLPKINKRLTFPLEAVAVIALVPWIVRFFIALPRLFFPGVSEAAIFFDSLLLNLDRNYFSALLPFYWLAFTTYFSIKSRTFLRADIILTITLFLVIFSITPAASIEAYRWPILMIGIFAITFFMQVLAFILSLPPELAARRKEKLLGALFVFLLIVLGGILFFRPFQERAVGQQGGGLLEPGLLFRFDFSQVLRLESEINLNDDLVMIVRRDPDDFNNLLRRYTLSGYNPRQGFFRLDDIDEAAHPQRLPGRHTILPVNEIRSFRITKQEYYLVNFDPSAFIGMNKPVEIIPFETWDASSFNSAYAVISHTSQAMPFELIMAVQGEPSAENLGMSAEEYAIFTYYGGDEAIAAFAREIVSRDCGRPLSYWEKIELIYVRLKYGEFRYSLRPGIAPDGNQLHHFLFTTKRGYCSYFAFAFTLMLRSLGIPSRVAAGFFLDPSTEVFNYFPVRADMAHAWSEVWFPGYGWIEFDPTTQQLAPGEDFVFSQGTPPELFERLLHEILENRSRLRVREGEDIETQRGIFAALGRNTLDFFVHWGAFLILAALLFLLLSLRLGFLCLSFLNRRPRTKALYLWAHTKQRLALAGLKKPQSLGEAEWAVSFEGLYDLYLDSAASRFAPAFSAEDFCKMTEHYRFFAEEYRKTVPLCRRILAWLLPPLALVLRPSSKQRLSLNKASKITGIILIGIFLFSLSPKSAAQDGIAAWEMADQLFENAMTAQRAENWERTVELLNEGVRAFPWDHRFSWSLGNLYFNRRLFRLAWDEYRRAERILKLQPFDHFSTVALYFQLAYTAGFLNKNELSVEYLEKILALEPNNREAIGTLAWMYFKIHRLSDGERLLVNAIERLGDDSDFSMTLGTIYSAMFQYEKAKASYMNAIRTAEAFGDRLFLAIVFYNLSILESRFYQYSLAYDAANASLRAMNRSSGRLARGELYLRRMELNRSLTDFQEAFGMDNSPLSKLSLAQVFFIGGRLSEALLYAKACLRSGDDSWMLNYGIDPVRYRRDIHEVLKNIYEGLFRAEAFSVPSVWFAGTIRESTQSFFRRIYYRFRFAVHSHLFRKYSLHAANAHTAWRLTGEIPLEALSDYFNAFAPYRRRALTYLERARLFEEPLIPESAASYDFIKGRLLRNRELLEFSLLEFDPLWQRDRIAAVYAEMAKTGRRAARIDAAERLFAINRGALLRSGLELPAAIQFSEEIAGLSRTEKRALKRAAGNSGLHVIRQGSPRFTLRFDTGNNEGYIYTELYDGGRGIVVFRQYLPVPQARAQRAAFVQALRNGVFNAF